MDVVTKNLVATFKVEELLPDDIAEDVIFEHFANYCVVSQNYGEEFDVDDIHTGGGNDLGLDGIAILVNGNLVSDVSEVDDLANLNKFLDVEFVFNQAKSSGNFDGASISSLFFGLKDLFSEKPKLPRNDNLQDANSTIDKIYAKSALFKKGNPKVKIYYVTTGKWENDSKLNSRIDIEVEGLMALNIFESVNFYPVDARTIQNLYKRAKNKLSKSVLFSEKLTLPALEGIDESYLGYLSADEYIKLITDDAGTIVRGLFYDNVRDFQGENPVNHEIDETLQSDGRNLFVLLNNGITIVADSLKKTGDTFTIEDYQIVNGCQTSHVLYNNKDKLTAGVKIPVKLIVSQNSEVKNKIIKATNRQTPVKTEELTALTDFQKTLEDYYEAIQGDERLYYERRSQQFRATAGIEKIKIVSVSNQIRSFASMFLGLPHQASRYYGTLLKDIEKSIFVNGQPPAAYYASAFALYRIEALVRRKQVDRKYRPFRYHLIAAFRMIVMGTKMDAMNSNKFERACKPLIDAISDDKKSLAVFEDAIGILDGLLVGDYSRDKAKDANLYASFEKLIAAR
ncbi:AIPR family protein [Devosia ginsengisoli]|uniref:AIPR family protein n=1 Tax=Devosia ginsengisoli TaxID=400770 RepID=A0A5B8LP88_9HYPH|nr:AIPR family protein [Devosia ginsengisoli]QDZ10157.1 AIPR family protein [Devosia ginsengisoli]